MNTFYGKIDNKGDALTMGVEFLLYPGAPHRGIGVAAPVPFSSVSIPQISSQVKKPLAILRL
jgi:hypothetical protein